MALIGLNIKTGKRAPDEAQARGMQEVSYIWLKSGCMIIALSCDRVLHI